MQISNISHDDPRYPDMLRDLHDAPKSINVLGTLPNTPMIAIVGTRSLTPYGEQITYQLASELARAGAIIVSGLAIGVDGIAQRAALDAGGKTIAVLAHGLDQIYPARHRGMAREILATGGALVSEYDVGTQPDKFRFVERNRIIAGLSAAVIVTESGVKGGSLITVARGLLLGRQIMAVPGNITSPMSVGTNNLIRTGAKAIVSSADIISELGFLSKEPITVSAQSPDEARLVELIGTGITTNDGLIEASGLSAAKFANIITLMEITGKIRNLGAGNWVIR